MSTQPYPAGMDCVWLASDRDGKLGAFITSGVGPIPTEVLDAVYLSVEHIEDRLFQLPPVSDVQLLVSVKRPGSFIDLAERGLFVYDWTDVHRTAHEERRVYEPVAVPTKPIDARSLPSDFATLATALRLAEVVFAAGEAVDIRAHLSCAESV